MIIRIWRPLQHLVQRHAAIATALAIAVLALLAWLARARLPDLPQHHLVVAGALLAMLLWTARRRQAWPLLVLACALGVVVAMVLPGDAFGAAELQALLGAAVALALPLATSLRPPADLGRLEWAIGRGTHYAVVAAHFAALALFISDLRPAVVDVLASDGGLVGDGRLALGVAVAAVATVVLAPAWVRPRADGGDALRFLPRPERARALLPWWVGALVLAAALGSALWRGLPAGVDRWTWIALAVSLAIWAAATVRLDRVVAAGCAQVAALAFCAWLPEAAQPHGVDLALALALAQLAPLAATMTLEAQGGWHLVLPAFIAIALALGLNGLPAQWPLVIAAACGWAVVPGLALRPRRTPPPITTADADARLAIMRRAIAGLEVAWRWYAAGKLRWDPIYHRLAGEPRAWGKVLDAGCGSGLGLALCAARRDVDTWVGVDLDHDKLLVAARVLADGDPSVRDRFRLAEARLPLPHPWPLTFDTVLLIDVLHYWDEPTQRALLAQLHDALAPGGALYLRDGVAAADGATGAVGLGERFTTAIGLNPGTGLHFLAEERLRALLDDCGFTITAVEPMGGANRLVVCFRE